MADEMCLACNGTGVAPPVPEAVAPREDKVVGFRDRAGNLLEDQSEHPLFKKETGKVLQPGEEGHPSNVALAAAAKKAER